MRILVVEDEDEMRHSLAERLLAEEVESVDQASDLANALGLLRHADAVLCDDAFPVVRGERPFELAWNAVYEAAQTLSLPFVLLTTDSDTWHGALGQGVRVFKKQDAAEAVLHLLRALREQVLTG